MTLKENIMKLQTYKMFEGEDTLYVERDDVLKLLKQEPRYCDRNICLRNEYNGIGCDECEVTKSQQLSGDLISRQAVLDLIADYDLSMGQVVRGIHVLPPVKPQEQNTGHWIEYTRVLIPEPINRREQAWYCSECGYGNQECEDGSAWLEWKYCPKCGTKMVKEQERSEQNG
jgi:hypothetical protein